MGVKSTVSGITLAANHVAAASAAGHSASGLHSEVKIKCDEAVVALRTLLSTMVVGDSNIATINAQITALS